MYNRMKKKVLLWVINHLLSGTHFFSLKRILLNHITGVEIGANSKIVGPLKVSGTINVGENVWIGRDFSAEGHGNVKIGSNCDIAPCVSFYTGSHRIGNHNRRAGEGLTEDISVGDGSWICAGVMITPGVSISSGVVVAAGSVVSKSCLEEDVLLSGNRAKVVKKLQ